MDEATALILRQIQTDVRDVREAADEVRKSVAKLWTELRELSATVQGADGGNGIRSDVRELEKWRARVEQHLTDLSAKLQHYLDVEREKTCHGKAALKRHEEEHEEACEEETEMKVAQIQTAGATKVQVLTLIGVILSPVIMAIVTKILEEGGK